MQKTKGLSGGRCVGVCASGGAARRRLRSASAAAVAALGLIAGPAAQAQTTYTGAGGNNNWSNAGNWSSGEPTLAVDAILGAPLAGSPIVLDAAGEQAQSLTFNANYVLNSGSLTLGNGTVTIDPSIVGTINSILNGSNGLTLNPTTGSGTGTLVLTGTNGFTGAVAVQGGTLRFGADANLGTATNTVTLGTDATTGTLDYTGSTATIARAVALGTTTSGGGVINVATAGQTLTLSGVISGGAANAAAAGTLGNTSLTITGAGKVALTGTNTFTGNVVVDGGTLVFSGTDAQLGATPAGAFKTVVLQNGGTFAQTGGAPYNPNDGTSTANKRFLIGAGGGTIDVGSGFTLQLDDPGQFGGTAAGGSLTKAGAGRLYLANSYPSYDGAQTFLNGGTIEVRTVDALGDAIAGTKTVVNMAAGTALDMRNNAATNFGYPIVLTGAAGSAYTFNVDRTSAGTALFHTVGPVSVGATAQINVTGGNSFGLTTGTMTLGGNLTLNPTSGQLAIAAIDAGAASPARTITKTGAFPVTVNGAGTNFAGTTTVNVTAGALFLGNANAFGPAANVTATNTFSQVGQTVAAAAGYTYSVPADGVLAGNAAFFNSLTVGGNVNLIPATIAETAAGGNAAAVTALALPNDASRFFGVAGAITDSVAVGTGTPWAGISNDNAPARSYAGTITANSDFTVRATNGQTFALNAVTLAPSAPRTMTVTGGVVTFNSSASSYNSNVTIAVASGATLQPTANTVLGTSTTPASNAAVNVLSGGTFNPNAGVTVNNTVTIQPGGILLVDDANNLAGTGSYVQSPGSVTRITNNGANALGGTVSPGTVPGSVVRIETNGIGLLPTKVDNAANFVVANNNRVLIAGTPAAPSIALNSAGAVTVGGVSVPTAVLTNDGASRTLAIADTTTAGQNAIATINVGANGATLAATTGFTLTFTTNLQSGAGTGGVSLNAAGNPLTIGIPGATNLDGQTGKAGTVSYGGGSGVTFQAGSVNVVAGTFTAAGGGMSYQIGGNGTPGNGSGVGLLTVNSGTTFISATGALIDGQLNVLAGGTARFQPGTDNTVATQSVSGLQGAGSLVLGGSGGTNRDTALTVGANNVSSTFAGVISDNSGTNQGQLIKAGTGTLTLAGNNTYTLGTTVSAGTLQLGNGGTAGTVAGPVTNNAALVVNRSNDFALAGAISGTGSLTKTGAGTVTLSAAPTYTGATTVTGGGLTITAATTSFPTSGLSVAGGARFSYLPATAGALSLGSGTLTLADGSQLGLAFGSSIGTTGTASTAGTVNFAIPAGAAFTSGQPYTFVTAGGGLDAASYAVLNPGNFTYTVSKTATAVVITPTAATAATTLFWKGGYAGNVFTASNGDSTTPQSNFTTDPGGATASALTPGATTAVTFSATGATGQGAITLGANASVLSLASTDPTAVTINPDGNTLTLAQATAGNNALQLAAGAGSLTVGSNVTAGGSQTWTNSSTTGSVLRVGSAGTTVSLGTNTVTVAGPGTTTIAGDLNGAGGVLTKTSTGTLNLTGGPGTLKQLNLNAAGVLDIGASNLTVSNGGSDTIQSSITTGTAVINATGGGAIVLNVNNSNGPDNGVANGGTLQINARVTGTSTFEFYKAGVTTGVIYLANNANDFTGGIVANQGVIRVDTFGNTGSPSGLGTGGTLLMGGAGTVRYTGAGETSNKVVSLYVANGTQTLDASGTGKLTLTSNFTAPGVGSKTLALTGSGVGEISGAVVNNATVGSTQLSATFAAGATTVTLNSVEGIVNGASISGTGIAAGTTVTAVNTATRVVTLSTAASAASGNAGTSYTVAGVLNPTALTKTGAGTWVLSGANTYTGPTTVSAGTLLVNGSLTSSVTANGATATVGGSGSIAGALTVTAGRLSPGNSPGVLSVSGPLSLSNAASYLAELGGTTPGGYDQTLIGGAATLGGAALSVAPVDGFVPAASDVFFILARGDSAANTTFFANAAEGDIVNLVNGGTGQITYVANWTGNQATSTLTGGNDVAIYNVTGVPEPTAATALLGAAAAGLLARRRRRSR